MKIKSKYNDSINIRFWNVIFSFVILTICLCIYDLIFKNSTLIKGITTSINFFGWISIIASGMFIIYILHIRALGIGKASVTQAIRSTIVIFTIPVSLILSYFSIIPLFSIDPMSLLIKISGITLIIFGILSYALTQVKAYLFITIKKKGNIKKIMNQFWAIRGVSHVSAVSGPFDLIVKIKTRTLIKGYERILNKVEQIKDVKGYRWESVLKDWERI
jgi:DNA-binding Lrp family transcriptional regulator